MGGQRQRIEPLLEGVKHSVGRWGKSSENPALNLQFDVSLHRSFYE